MIWQIENLYEEYGGTAIEGTDSICFVPYPYGK